MRGWRPPMLMQSGAPPFDEDVLDPDCSMAAQSLHLYAAGYRFHVLPQVCGAKVTDMVALTAGTFLRIRHCWGRQRPAGAGRCSSQARTEQGRAKDTVRTQHFVTAPVATVAETCDDASRPQWPASRHRTAASAGGNAANVAAAQRDFQALSRAPSLGCLGRSLSSAYHVRSLFCCHC